jgi:hypothetical protein
MLGSDDDLIVICPSRGLGQTVTFGKDNSPWWRAISVIGIVMVDPSWADSAAKN